MHAYYLLAVNYNVFTLYSNELPTKTKAIIYRISLLKDTLYYAYKLSTFIER